MKLRNLMFVLPNLFTVSTIFCGFYAITLCTGEKVAAPQLYQAALTIFFAIFFDGFDGRVARLTKTQSMFGQELDSLADFVAFGVAPALLVWKWAFQPFGLLGIFISFLFAACGALRLARFNVLAMRSTTGGSNRFFVGMPTPFAAAGVVSMVIAFHHAKEEQLSEQTRWLLLSAVTFLALLMVSTVRYRTFKNIKPTTSTVSILLGIIAAGVVMSAISHPSWVLMAYFALYLLLGLAESAFMLKRYFTQKMMSHSFANVADKGEAEPHKKPPD